MIKVIFNGYNWQCMMETWKGNIDIGGYDSPEGAYNIHIYLVDGNGDLYNIAQTTKNISN